MYDSIRPGQLWLDTDGKPIQAHGMTVRYDENAKLFYWFGENKEKTVGGADNTIWHWGVRLYTSSDFYNWHDEGLIIPPVTDDLSCPLHPTYCVDRPHIIFCKKTGKYVAWLKIMMDTTSQFMYIMTADDLRGPYTPVNSQYYPLEMDAGDFWLEVDKDTEKAYIFYERPHFELICATLTDDYTACSGEFSTHYPDRKPPYTREAPAFFTHGGKKYLFTSGTTGYFPNKTTVCVFDDYHGEYRDLGDPCIDDKSNTTFSTQICNIIRIPGKELYVACGDRWVIDEDVPERAESVIREFEKGFENYQPDRTPRKVHEPHKCLQKHAENTSVSRYVFLPIEWDGEKPVIRWRDEWRIEDFD